MFAFTSDKSHVDGPGSHIEFHISVNPESGVPELRVTGHIAGGTTSAPILGSPLQEPYLEVAGDEWQEFINNVTRNTLNNETPRRGSS